MISSLRTCIYTLGCWRGHSATWRHCKEEWSSCKYSTESSPNKPEVAEQKRTHTIDVGSYEGSRVVSISQKKDHNFKKRVIAIGFRFFNTYFIIYIIQRGRTFDRKGAQSSTRQEKRWIHSSSYCCNKRSPRFCQYLNLKGKTYEAVTSTFVTCTFTCKGLAMFYEKL